MNSFRTYMFLYALYGSNKITIHLQKKIQQNPNHEIKKYSIFNFHFNLFHQLPIRSQF